MFRLGNLPARLQNIFRKQRLEQDSGPTGPRVDPMFALRCE